MSRQVFRSTAILFLLAIGAASVPSPARAQTGDRRHHQRSVHFLLRLLPAESTDPGDAAQADR